MSDQRCDCRDDGCLTDLLGRPGWPVAAIVIAVMAWFALDEWQGNANKHDLDTRIVAECAHEESVQRCADNIRKALDD